MCASHDILKKHDQLEFEEHNGINRGSTITCIGFLHELTHKREVEGAFQVTVEMILRDSFFQRDMDERSKMPLFASHHRAHLSLFPAHEFPVISNAVSSAVVPSNEVERLGLYD